MVYVAPLNQMLKRKLIRTASLHAGDAWHNLAACSPANEAGGAAAQPNGRCRAASCRHARHAGIAAAVLHDLKAIHKGCDARVVAGAAEQRGAVGGGAPDR